MTLREVSEQMLLTEYEPTSILINEKGELLHIHGNTAKYFEQSTNEAKSNILQMTREELRMPLSAAIRHASAQKKSQTVEVVSIKIDNESIHVQLSVAPVLKPVAMQGLMLVTLTQIPSTPGTKAQDGRVDDSHTQQFVSLEQELSATPEYLETVDDELQSANNEEALRESENHFNYLFDSFPFPSFIWKPDGATMTLTAVNHAADAASQNKARTFVGHKATEIYPNRPDLVKGLMKCLREKSVFSLETPYVMRTSGHIEYVIFTYVFVEPDMVMLHVERITERKRAEEQLRFRAELLNAVGQSIIATDAEGIVVYLNLAAEKLYGWSQAEALGKNIVDVTVPQLSQDTAAEIMTRLSEGNSWSGEFFVRRRNGTIFPAAVHDTPIFDEAGKFTGVIGISYDITERKQAEELLRQSEIRTKTILDTMLDGGQLISHDWRYLYLNDAVIPQSGYPRRVDLLGYTMMEKYPGIEKSELFTNLRRCMEERTPHRMENHFNGPDGSDGWFDLYIHPVPEGLFILSHDITERKRADAERQAHEQQMVENQRLQSLGLLAGGVAHDINNLLTPIWTSIELLRIRCSNDAETNELFDAIVTATQRTSILVRQMLAFAGRHHLSLAQEELNGLITENQTLLRSSLPKTVVIKLDLAPEPLPFIADRTQIQQVVMNLILNAIDAFAGSAGEICVSTRREPSTSAASSMDVVLVVRDTGPGIATENLSRIFEPFFTTKNTGHGLGLSATQGIIRAHRGRLEVQSVLGEGTTFTIRLPMETSTITPAAPLSTHSAHQPSKAIATQSSQNVWLVIDDEPLVRRSTCRVLKVLQVRTLEAEDGATGITLARQHAAELTGVVLDLTMPGMSGRDVFQQLRAEFPTLPVVFLSGYSEHAVQDLVVLPKVAFLTKPYIPQTLQQIIVDLSQ